MMRMDDARKSMTADLDLVETLREFSVSDDHVWTILSPFVSRQYAEDDAEWKALVGINRGGIRRHRWQRLMSLLRSGQMRRNQMEIERVYSERWEEEQYKPFRIPLVPKGGSPYVWGGKRLRATNAGARRVRIYYLMRLIEALKPRRVLEIGFGEGVNLALLAARFPECEFAGIELTEGGTGAAHRLQALPALPPELVEFSPMPLRDASRHRAVDFHRGSATDLPWDSNSFDLVFSSLALEQMEEVRSAALREAARVSRAVTAMIEPFREFNDRGLRRSYIKAFDYFQGAVSDLPSFGLTPIKIIDSLPAKVTLKPALVICSR